jgi:hypothetical protein
MEDTLLVLSYLPVTKRAALLWTFSISSLFFFVCGAQTVEQYPKFDLTIALYAFSFVDSFLIFKFLLKNPSNLFALLVMFPIWVFQFSLYRLEKWEKTWGMEFHSGKCNSMSITRARSPFERRYTLKGNILEDVKETKYLGLALSSNLNWNTHIGNITSKANKLLGFLRRNLKIRNESTKENAYKAIVRIKPRILLNSLGTTYKKEQR